MILQRTATHSLSGLGALALIAGAVAGCAPTPAPTPTPTAAFASEEEAFAKAEEVYRAYIDALNAYRAGEAGPSPDKFLTGELLDSEIAASEEMEKSGTRIVGETRITKFNGTTSDIHSSVGSIEATACLDVTSARAIDDTGADVTTPGRSDLYAIHVTFVGSRSSLLVSEYEVAPGTPC